MTTSIYRFGSNNNLATVVGFDYNTGTPLYSTVTTPMAPGNSWRIPTPTNYATDTQVGPVWGLAYNRFAQRLYAGAFVKRYVTQYNADDSNSGAIFVISSLSDPTIWVRLEDFGFVTRPGVLRL